MILFDKPNIDLDLQTVKKFHYYWRPLNHLFFHNNDMNMTIKEGGFLIKSKTYGEHPVVMFTINNTEDENNCLKISLQSLEIVYNGLPELSDVVKNEALMFVSKFKNHFIHFWMNGDYDEFLDYDYLNMFYNTIKELNEK